MLFLQGVQGRQAPNKYIAILRNLIISFGRPHQEPCKSTPADFTLKGFYAGSSVTVNIHLVTWIKQHRSKVWGTNKLSNSYCHYKTWLKWIIDDVFTSYNYFIKIFYVNLMLNKIIDLANHLWKVNPSLCFMLSILFKFIWLLCISLLAIIGKHVWML